MRTRAQRIISFVTKILLQTQYNIEFLKIWEFDIKLVSCANPVKAYLPATSIRSRTKTNDIILEKYSPIIMSLRSSEKQELRIEVWQVGSRVVQTLVFSMIITFLIFGEHTLHKMGVVNLGV